LLKRTEVKEELKRVEREGVVGCKVTIAFIIIFGMCRREGV
jgi:hypothetical protein